MSSRAPSPLPVSLWRAEYRDSARPIHAIAWPMAAVVRRLRFSINSRTLLEALRVQMHGHRHLVSASCNAFDGPRNKMAAQCRLSYPGLFRVVSGADMSALVRFPVLCYSTVKKWNMINQNTSNPGSESEVSGDHGKKKRKKNGD